MSIAEPDISKLRLLMVEDDEAYVDLIKNILVLSKDYDFELVVAKSLKEADEKLNGMRVDLTLLDLNLPDSKGINTFTQLMKLHPYVPIVILTNISDVRGAINLVHSGAQAYLVKSELNQELLIRTICFAIEIKQKEVRLSKLAEQLEDSNMKLQHFASIAAHDLKSPLGIIQGYANLLWEDKELKDKNREFLGRIQESTGHMLKLISNILEQAKPNTEHKREREELNLGDIIDKAMNNLEIRIKESKAKFDILDMPTISGDETQLIQLFQNLMSNSIKYAREGVAPHVRIYSRTLRERRVRTGMLGRKVHLVVVEDNGIGIDKQHREYVFGMFNRVRESDAVAGAGIGLSTCKQIVENHGGQISIKGKKGKGTRFIISFYSEAT